jgi:hypothetical protein
MNTPDVERFTGGEILDELIRRLGPDGALREFIKGLPHPVSSINRGAAIGGYR